MRITGVNSMVSGCGNISCFCIITSRISFSVLLGGRGVRQYGSGIKYTNIDDIFIVVIPTDFYVRNVNTTPI